MQTAAEPRKSQNSACSNLGSRQLRDTQWMFRLHRLACVHCCYVNPDELVDTVMPYIKLCEHNVNQMKTIRFFPNNKPWITKYVKFMLNQKKLAFLQEDASYVRNLNKTFRSKVKWRNYSTKTQLSMNYCLAMPAMRGKVWILWLVGINKKPLVSENPDKFVNDINKFYARFDIND